MVDTETRTSGFGGLGVGATRHPGEQALPTSSKASHPVGRPCKTETHLESVSEQLPCACFSPARDREAARTGRDGLPAAPGGGQGTPRGAVVRGFPLLRAQGDLPAAELAEPSLRGHCVSTETISSLVAGSPGDSGLALIFALFRSGFPQHSDLQLGAQVRSQRRDSCTSKGTVCFCCTIFNC